jgi:hypothetical protein
MIKIVILEKNFINDKRESAIIYIYDLTKFARVFLITTKMIFEID